MDERFRFIVDYESGDWSMAELCRRYEISRPFGYMWLARYRSAGLQGLQDRSRRPRRCPHTLAPQTEDAQATFGIMGSTV